MSDATKQAVVDAIQAHLKDSNDDEENRVVTDFILTTAFINLDRPGGITGYFHECHGANHSLMGLTNIQGMWLDELYLEKQTDEDPDMKDY